MLESEELTGDFPVPVIQMEDAIALLKKCRDMCKELAQAQLKIHGSKELASAILEVLRGTPGKKFSAKELLTRIPKEIAEPLRRLREEGNDAGLRAAIAKSMAMLRRDGHPIPKGRYAFEPKVARQ